MGNHDEIFTLYDGSIWRVQYEYEYLYEYYPNIVICPNKNIMIINNKKLNVELLSGNFSNESSSNNLIESRVDGSFNGFEGETIIKLRNGQIWQQTEYYYRYRYSYSPNVIIYKENGRFKMKIDGIDRAVGVTQLK